jgi:hypoxanthine phosphoribosyltransferase
MIVPPKHLDLLYPSEAIDTQLDRLAATLDDWTGPAIADTGRLLLAVCLLRGGVFFFSDVLLHMHHSVEPAFCRAWAYSKVSNEKPEEIIRMEWQGLEPAGRDVVVFDNICDSGRTLVAAINWLKENGARSVRTVTMVYRERPDSAHKPTLAGFTFSGKEWLVGYGLRDRDAHMMNTRMIYTARGTGI